MSYFEVPEEDAQRVMKYVDGQNYKGRDVRCNDAAEGGKAPRTGKSRVTRDSRDTRDTRDTRESRATRKPRDSREPGNNKAPKKTYQKDEWMQFLNPKGMKLKGEIPDFEEEGWAIRKPRKKK